MKTNWFKRQVDNEFKFRGNFNCEIDICNLGSNSSKYAFSYGVSSLKGENWALGPQTLSYDFRILKNYHSYLKVGATVLIPICPFSGCITDYENDSNNYKYYNFLNPIYILNYSQVLKDRLTKSESTDYQLTLTKIFVKRLIKNILGYENKIMTENNLEIDSNKWISNWKKEFSIVNLNEPVSLKNFENIKYNAKLIAAITEFCYTRSLIPVIVIPPVNSFLSTKLSNKFRENYIQPLFSDLISKDIKILNYLDDEEFSKIEFYFNSYFLNKKGRKLFTKRVLQDLKLIP